MSEWRKLSPGFWRRDVPGGWLGVKREGARWMWVHTVDGFRFASSQCFGLETAAAAMASADSNLQPVVCPPKKRARCRSKLSLSADVNVKL